MGVWMWGGMGEKNPPTHPYSHTEWKPEPNVELHKLMHASVSTVKEILRGVLDA